LRGWLGGLASALAAAMLATAASAQVGDVIGDKLGPLHAPPGGKAYRVTWDGDWAGYVEATIDAAGKVRMRRGPPGAPATEVALEPGDLAAFELEVEHSSFAATPPPTAPFLSGCVDECVDYFLTVAADGMAKTLHADLIHMTAEEAERGRRSSGPAILDAALELIELADARSGDRRGRPAPWWTPEWLERPSPSIPGADACRPADAACAQTRWAAWASLVEVLGFQDLRGSAPSPETRFYRFVWFPSEGPAAAVMLTRELASCGVMLRPDPRCDDRALVRTSARRKPRRVAPADEDRVEAGLYAAGFSTMAVDPQTRCPTGDHWVLEAYVEARYRYVAGSSCDLRGLDAPIAQLRSWIR
jgi:hypothetical protein